MTQPTETTTDTLLDAIVAHVEAENAEEIELPEPAVMVPFPTVL
ncbi:MULTISPECIES: hypothetical protein [unclassified Methylobacterium]|jgi:hypothetical protein|nr:MULTISPECIES: hypothetical protein [unclassified Methylobacterium]